MEIGSQMYLIRAAGFALMGLCVFSAVVPVHAVERSSGFAVTNNYEHDAGVIVVDAADDYDSLSLEQKIASNAVNIESARQDRERAIESARQASRRATVCFFKHANFRGRKLCVNAGEGSRLLSGFNDQISSIKVRGNIDVYVCEHATLGGRCMTIEQDVAYVGDQWNDLISSFQVSVDPTATDSTGGVAATPGGSATTMADQVCFYKNQNYLYDRGRGERTCMTPGEEHHFLSDFNDAISAIDLEGDAYAKVCKSINGYGPCLIVTDDMANLGDGFDNEISYVRVFKGPTTAHDHHPTSVPDAVCLYEDPNFRGRQVCAVGVADVGSMSRLNDKISSIQLHGNVEVRVCEHFEYGGRCMTVEQDMEYVGNQWSDMISSFQAGEVATVDSGPAPVSDSHPAPVSDNQRALARVACFYEHANFEGRRVCANAGIKEGSMSRLDDEVSSIIVQGGVEVRVCEHAEHGGRCGIVGENLDHLGEEWNDLISSYEVSY